MVSKGRDLAIEAMRHADEPLRLVVAGDGTQGDALRRKAAATGISSRVESLGQVSDSKLIDLYANALAVVYPPYDEDDGSTDGTGEVAGAHGVHHPVRSMELAVSPPGGETAAPPARRCARRVPVG